MKIVFVEWNDSCSLVGGGVWADKAAVEELGPHKCQSVGWVVKEDKECIVIVSSLSDHQYSGEICIPKPAITKMTHLKAISPKPTRKIQTPHKAGKVSRAKIRKAVKSLK